MFDGTELLWTEDGGAEWSPLDTEHLPGLPDVFDAIAPDDSCGFAPPALAAACEGAGAAASSTRGSQAQGETVMAVRAAESGAAPYPNWTAVGVTWLAGFDFEIKVIARIPGVGA